MGASKSKPEFKSVFDDQYVKYGETVVLSCDVVKTRGEITATWKKNDYTLQCVKGKHEARKESETFTLEIQNAEGKDEGKYTLTVENAVGSTSHEAMVYVALKRPWREVKWENKDGMVRELGQLTISNSDVKELRFLLYGLTGAGKSSTINTIKSIFAERQMINCLAAAGSSKSQTLRFEKFVISKANEELLPFAFFDMMGIEQECDEKNKMEGVLTDDIIMSLKGHVNEGYTFNPTVPLTAENHHYIANPNLNEKMHCLLCVVSAERLSLMQKKHIDKMITVRSEASRLGIPQVVFLTKVDCIWPLTEQSLQNVYKIKKVKDKIKECSNILTVPENCIFPVHNYHKETHMNDDINCLMLDALIHIVHWANDYVKKFSKK